MTDDLADHVLGLRWRGIRVLFPFPADWPLGDVVWPDVGRDAGWSFAKAEQGYSTVFILQRKLFSFQRDEESRALMVEVSVADPDPHHMGRWIRIRII
jgi:hypothetical protein